MAAQVMNLLSLSALCDSKEKCVAFLQQRGIVHQQLNCANGHAMTLSLSEKEDRWRCRRKNCNKQIQLKSGTWLQGSHLTYREIILFIYCWSHEMTTIDFCKRELNISHPTVVDYNNFLREVCASTLLANPITIGGPNTTVEIDESMFSRRKNHVGRVLPQQWVFGGICRETGENFLYAVPDRSANTLIPIIQNSIRPGTTIISDMWQSYNEIPNLGNNYTHLTVNHSKNFVDPITGAHTQKIESTWNKAKSRNRKHFGTSRHLLDSYLCEFMWRNRLNGRDPFATIINDIVAFWPPL